MDACVCRVDSIWAMGNVTTLVGVDLNASLSLWCLFYFSLWMWTQTGEKQGSERVARIHPSFLSRRSLCHQRNATAPCKRRRVLTTRQGFQALTATSRPCLAGCTRHCDKHPFLHTIVFLTCSHLSFPFPPQSPSFSSSLSLYSRIAASSKWLRNFSCWLA